MSYIRSRQVPGVSQGTDEWPCRGCGSRDAGKSVTTAPRDLSLPCAAVSPCPPLDPTLQGSPPPMHTLYHVTWWHGRGGGVQVIILRIGSSASRTGRHEAVMLFFILWYRVWLPCGPAWPGLLDGCGLVLAQLRLTSS